MQNVKTYFIGLAAIAFISLGCDYLEADDVCTPVVDAVESCSELDDDLALCDPYAEINVPGCHVEPKCDAEGDHCEDVCEGTPVPCDQFAKDACEAAINCEWWNDPANIDREAE